MMRKLLAGCALNLLLVCAAFAGGDHEGGHDHGEAKTAAPAMTSGAPRLVMASPQFELVGTLESNGLHLLLDDTASNAPVTDAALELEIAGQRITAQAAADGSYHATLPQALPDGQHPVMATILTEQAADLLTGELAIHAADTHDAHATNAMPTADHGWHFLPWLVALLAVAAAVTLFTLRQDRASRGKKI